MKVSSSQVAEYKLFEVRLPSSGARRTTPPPGVGLVPCALAQAVARVAEHLPLAASTVAAMEASAT